MKPIYILATDAAQKKFISDAKISVEHCGLYRGEFECFDVVVYTLAEIRANERGFTLDIERANYPK